MQHVHTPHTLLTVLSGQEYLLCCKTLWVNVWLFLWRVTTVILLLIFYIKYLVYCLSKKQSCSRCPYLSFIKVRVYIFISTLYYYDCLCDTILTHWWVLWTIAETRWSPRRDVNIYDSWGMGVDSLAQLWFSDRFHSTWVSYTYILMFIESRTHAARQISELFTRDSDSVWK